MNYYSKCANHNSTLTTCSTFSTGLSALLLDCMCASNCKCLAALRCDKKTEWALGRWHGIRHPTFIHSLNNVLVPSVTFTIHHSGYTSIHSHPSYCNSFEILLKHISRVVIYPIAPIQSCVNCFNFFLRFSAIV